LPRRVVAARLRERQPVAQRDVGLMVPLGYLRETAAPKI